MRRSIRNVLYVSLLFSGMSPSRALGARTEGGGSEAPALYGHAAGDSHAGRVAVTAGSAPGARAAPALRSAHLSPALVARPNMVWHAVCARRGGGVLEWSRNWSTALSIRRQVRGAARAWVTQSATLSGLRGGGLCVGRDVQSSGMACSSSGRTIDDKEAAAAQRRRVSTKPTPTTPCSGPGELVPAWGVVLLLCAEKETRRAPPGVEW